MDTKNAIISKVYYDPDVGFGSIENTFKEAKKYSDSITIEDVKRWKDNHVGRKTQLRGYNSFIPVEAYQEYQMDIAFFSDLNKEAGERLPYAFLMIDAFTKYIQVVPIDTKTPEDVLEGIKELIKLMQAKPDTIYSDEEGAFVSNIVQRYLRNEVIRHLVTRAHAPIAERAIRTIKNMIYKRVEHEDNPQWTDYIESVLNQYNNKMVCRITGYTPKDARLAKFRSEIRFNIRKHSNFTRTYPHISVGDRVRIYIKKDKLDKERTSIWSKDTYEVARIIESMGQNLYKTTHRDRPYMRHELLLVDSVADVKQVE